jgi:hypothetical protein
MLFKCQALLATLTKGAVSRGVLDSLQLQKFRTRYMKAMAKDKEVNIPVTNQSALQNFYAAITYLQIRVLYFF